MATLGSVTRCPKTDDGTLVRFVVRGAGGESGPPLEQRQSVERKAAK
jgi:hypothetical protein